MNNTNVVYLLFVFFFGKAQIIFKAVASIHRSHKIFRKILLGSIKVELLYYILTDPQCLNE